MIIKFNYVQYNFYYSDTELLEESFALYGVKLPPGGPRVARSTFQAASIPPYDATRYV